MNGPRFITIDEFDNYWGANLREMLRDSANPSNQADLFLARVENRLMSYIDNNTFRRYRYEDLRGGQLAAFKEAIILQAMYVYKNGDIGMDSGYDAEHGTLVKRTELVEISVCQDAIDILSNAGLWNLAMKNKPRTFGSSFGDLVGGGTTFVSSSSTATVDLSSVLKLTGGTMQGNIDMGVNSFTNVKETHYTISSEIGEVAVFKAESITYDDDVISIGASLYTKQLNATSLAVHFGWGVDDPIRIYRKITGNNNVLDFNANRLTNIATPVNDTDAVNKSYVEKSVKLTNELYLNDSNNVQCDTNLDVNATIVGDEIYETPADYTITNLRETLSVSSSGSATITPLNCKVDKIGNRLTITGAFGMRGTSEGTIEVQTVNEPAFGIVLPSGIYSKITDLNDKYVGSCTMKATGTYYTGNEELRIVFIDAGNNTIATMLYVSNTWNIENNNLMTYGTIFTYELTLLLGDSLF